MWKPIATAPRDGTLVLIFINTDRHGVIAAKWTAGQHGFETWCVDDYKFGPYCIRGYVESDITHWCPLPLPPGNQIDATEGI